MTTIDGINMRIADYGYHLIEGDGYYELFLMPYKYPILATEDEDFLDYWLEALISNLPVGHC